MKTLAINSIAGDHYEFTPEQLTYFQSQVWNDRKISNFGVLIEGFNPRIETPKREYKVTFKKVDGVIEPTLELGKIIDGDATVCIPFAQNIEGTSPIVTLKISCQKFFELHEETIARLARENPPKTETTTSSKKSSTSSEADRIANSILDLL